MTSLSLTLVLALSTQAPVDTSAEAEKEAAAERMAEMKELAKVYTFRRLADDKPYELQPEPVLRWNNPVSRITDGTIFVWTLDGRPALAGQVFTNNISWMHELVSLSGDPFSGYRGDEKVWDCDEPGLTFTKLAGAPVPAATETARLRQMRQLTKDFAASVDFKIDYRDAETSHYELRLLDKPILRYKSTDVLDGGLFAYVQGTNPEVWLLLEVRGEGADASWHYAFARMTGYAVQGKHKGVEVFNRPAWKRVLPQKGHLFHQTYKP